MTLAELLASPIGTTDIEVRANRHALKPETAFKATHREKISGAMRPKVFYGRMADEAREKAEDYDKKLKEKLQRWKSSTSNRRQQRS